MERMCGSNRLQVKLASGFFFFAETTRDSNCPTRCVWNWLIGCHAYQNTCVFNTFVFDPHVSGVTASLLLFFQCQHSRTTFGESVKKQTVFEWLVFLTEHSRNCVFPIPPSLEQKHRISKNCTCVACQSHPGHCTSPRTCEPVPKGMA